MIRLLLATVPSRRAACQTILDRLPGQTRVPDDGLLYCDGYPRPGTETPVPRSPLTVVQGGTTACFGPGERWRKWEQHGHAGPDDILVILDDDAIPEDTERGRHAIERLVAPVEQADICTAASGMMLHGAFLHWGSTYPPNAGPPNRCDGRLISAVASAMAVRARHLVGLTEWVRGLALPFDILGPGGDDEAAVSAYLWRQDVRIQHVQGVGLLRPQWTQDECELRKRTAYEKAHGLPRDWQRRALREATGWPWPEMKR